MKSIIDDDKGAGMNFSCAANSRFQPNGSLCVLAVVLKEFEIIRFQLGDSMAQSIDSHLMHLVGDFFKKMELDAGIISCGPASGEMVCFWGDERCKTGKLHDLAYTLKNEIQSDIEREVLRVTGREIQLGIGTSMGSWGDSFAVGVFQKTAEKSLKRAKDAFCYKNLTVAGEFLEILETRSIRSVYQPLYSLKDGGIMGWEALSRGPTGSLLQSPLSLFDIAEHLGQVFSLEQVCRHKAITSVGPMGSDQKLFLNIHPRTVVDPKFSSGRTLEMLGQSGLTPENIVFEITERHDIKDFSNFYKTLDHYRKQGFQVAIDDVGTGYSGLLSIAELRPDYMKIDRSLVQDVHRDPVKKALLETFTVFSNKIGSKIIAEGIEQREDVRVLMEIGVHYGQGYYLNRPAEKKTTSALNLKDITPLPVSEMTGVSCSVPIGQLAKVANTFERDITVCDAHKSMEDASHMQGVVVVDNGIPCGLVMRYRIDQKLSGRFGISLYYDKSIESVMDQHPLIVDEKEPVENVAQMAMARDEWKAYDDIVVTANSKVLGVVSVQKLLDTLSKVQIQMARGTNPLSGLPGNVALEQELEKRIEKDSPFTLVYADLDNFKVYNDTYGFKNGDKIILLLAKILDRAVKKHGGRDDFVAHIGGDDFVFITSFHNARKIGEVITSMFGRLVRYCYSENDRKTGIITGKDRYGKVRQFPLVSVSLGCLDCWGDMNLQKISMLAADVKKYAKSVEGNSFVRNRRKAGYSR
ncbi:MAG: GGDEF domain-containing protein [Desulfovibrio sp.]